jgi:hypothetical protein
MARGAKGRSRQADPSGQSTNQTRPERVKGTSLSLEIVGQIVGIGGLALGLSLIT